jgi:hypothetical protein
LCRQALTRTSVVPAVWQCPNSKQAAGEETLLRMDQSHHTCCSDDVLRSRKRSLFEVEPGCKANQHAFPDFAVPNNCAFLPAMGQAKSMCLSAGFIAALLPPQRRPTTTLNPALPSDCDLQSVIEPLFVMIAQAGRGTIPSHVSRASSPVMCSLFVARDEDKESAASLTSRGIVPICWRRHSTDPRSRVRQPTTGD